MRTSIYNQPTSKRDFLVFLNQNVLFLKIFEGIGNNKTIWPPPKILKNQRFEMEKLVLSRKERILLKLKELTYELKEASKTVC